MLVVAHILHHAAHLHRHLQRHQPGTHCNIRRGRLRRGHHHQFGVRQRLRHGNRHIAGAGRKIEQQHVRLAPPHIGQELLQRTLQSRSTPQNRTVRPREHADRNQLHTPRGHRHEHAVQIRRLRMHTEQARQGKTVDIRVDGGGIVAERRERGRKIRGHGGLAHTALAGRDGEHAGLDARFAERVLSTLGLERLHEIGQLALWHGTDLDMGNKRDIGGVGTGIGADGAVDLIGDGLAQRAILDGKLHVHGHIDDSVAVRVGIVGRRGLDRRDHAQIGDGTAQLRVDDVAQSFENTRFDGVNVVHDPPVCAYHLSGWPRATPEACSAALPLPRSPIQPIRLTGQADKQASGRKAAERIMPIAIWRNAERGCGIRR